MKRLLILPVVIVAAFALAGCKGDSTTVNTAPTDLSGITVSGRGEVEAPSDTGFFDVGVQVTAVTVEDARNRAAAAADAVIKSLKANGIDQKDIKTTNLSIQPQYDYKSPSEPRITGYIVTNTVTAKVRKLETFSKVIDDAVKAGGNDARIQSVRFGIEDDAKLLEQAREAAMKDARAKADQLAKLGGVTLGDPIAISETVASTPPIYAADAAGRSQANDVATPIEPGTGKVTIQITVRWALK